MTELVINITAGVIAGIISGLGVAYYFKCKEFNRELILSLYQYHLTITQIRMHLEFLASKVKIEDEDYYKIREILSNTGLPFHLKMGNEIEWPDGAEEIVINANRKMSALEEDVQRKSLSKAKIITHRNDLLKSTLEIVGYVNKQEHS